MTDQDYCDLIVIINRASVDETARDINAFMDYLNECEDEGVKAEHTVTENGKGATVYQLNIKFRGIKFKIRARSMHPYCSFEAININVDGSTFIARSADNNVVVYDTNDNPIDQYSMLARTVRELHKRIKEEF